MEIPNIIIGPTSHRTGPAWNKVVAHPDGGMVQLWREDERNEYGWFAAQRPLTGREAVAALLDAAFDDEREWFVQEPDILAAYLRMWES
mgnify:CR=1 FL=1